MNAATIKEWAEITQSVFTSAALIIGGIWTYLLFVKNRLNYPKAEITHEISHHQLDEKQGLLHLIVRVENIGDNLIELDTTRSWIEQIIPVPETVKEKMDGENLIEENNTEIEWPCAYGGSTIEKKWGKKEAEIEPGETEFYHFEFILDGSLSLIKIYSYIKNKKKIRKNGEIGWSKTTLYNLNGEKYGNKTGTAKSATGTT